MNIYFISGLGANHKAFEHLKIPQGFTPRYIAWKIPYRNESLQHYAHRMAEEIDTSQPFVLCGLSFGGIIAQEINSFLSPRKTLLISTIKQHSEKPNYMKFSKTTGAHKIIPISFFTSNRILSYTFFRNLYDPRMPKFFEYFTQKNHYYLKWSINQIIHWQPPQNEIPNLAQIHGTKDFVFPHSKIKDTELVEGGSHLMVLQKHREVSRFIQKNLVDLLPS